MSKKTVARRSGNFIADHKVGLLTVGLVGMTGVAIMLRFGLKQHDDFLRANDLYEAFYAQTD